MKFQVISCLLILIAGTLSLTCCQQKQEQAPVEIVPPQALSIAYPGELKEILANATESFHQKKPKLPNGATIDVTPIEINSLAAAQKIARGEIKPTLWITPTLALTDYVNSHLINLGAKQIGCRKIFSTRLVGAIGQAQRKKAFPVGTPFSRQKLLSLASSISIALPRADLSDTGIAAATYLTATDPSQLISNLERFLTLRRFGNEEHLLNTTVASYFGLPRASLTTEQKLIQHNSKISSPESLLEALYPADNGPELEYSVCTSEADWMSLAQKSAGNMFQEHLLGQSVQVAAQQLGFRAVQYVSESINRFTPALGVKAAPETTAEPISSGQIDSIFASQDIINPKTATMFIVDCSGSMQGTSILTAKRLVRSVLEESSDESSIGIIAFSAVPEIISLPTREKLALLPYVAGLEANGGSSLYDAILMGAELLQKPEYASVQRRLVVITDGNDQNSKTNLAFFGNAYQRRVGSQGLSLSLFFLQNGSTDTSDLKQISDLLNGSLRTLSPSISAEEFKKQIELG